MEPRSQRHASAKTAITRVGLSRPVRLALELGLFSADHSFFDFGCGKGGDLRELRRMGVQAAGWDPHYAPDATKTPAEVVNLGYVLNVLPSPAERIHALRDAWGLSTRVLVVSVRLESDVDGSPGRPLGDGWITAAGTFQKFFAQDEIRSLLEVTLEQAPVALAPGVFAVFRTLREREKFGALLWLRQRPPNLRQTRTLTDTDLELLGLLAAFADTHGRPPTPSELPRYAEVSAAFGSVGSAMRLLARTKGTREWTRAAEERRRDLVVYLALARFGHRPKPGDLPPSVRADVRAFFGGYAQATRQADVLLYCCGKPALVELAIRKAKVGKLMPSALYVHVSALPVLEPVLQVLEGCARVVVGPVPEANVVKLHRGKPAVSYLSYPSFESEGHPSLVESLLVRLDSRSASIGDYRSAASPPILHRKELLVSESHPLRPKFARLSLQEERAGLLGAQSVIGSKSDWSALLGKAGLRVVGHRLLRC